MCLIDKFISSCSLNKRTQNSKIVKRQPPYIRDYTDWTLADFEEDLRTNERYQTYFKLFTPESVRLFISYYASYKCRLHRDKEYYYSEVDYERSIFLLEAENFLKIILQKKLFNLQCLWRANQIDLPFIESTEDFNYFSADILNCPFLDPITEDELELGVRFLKVNRNEMYYTLERWQDYASFKSWKLKADSELVDDTMFLYYHTLPIQIPDFYDFYDKHYGTGHLLELPDLRFEKEKYYLKAVSDKSRQDELAKKQNETPVVTSSLKTLYNYYVTEEFLTNCEDAATKELIDLEANQNKLSRNYELAVNIEFMLLMDKEGLDIPLVPHKNWIQGIEDTVIHIKRTRAAEMLPYAYQTYILEYEDEDWAILKAQRVKRFKFDEINEKYNAMINRRETIKQGKILRGEDV